MKRPAEIVTKIDLDQSSARASPYDPVPGEEDDLWFLPGPIEDAEDGGLPWPVAAREGSLDPVAWQAGERAQLQGLVAAVQAAARFSERLAHAPDGVSERFAVGSVSAVLRDEGEWLAPEQIALYRVLRVVSDDTAQPLARASWAVRRLLSGATEGHDLPGDLAQFLGRAPVPDPQRITTGERPVVTELDALSERLRAADGALTACHPFTRAAHGFAMWRRDGITDWDELLEPTIAAMIRAGAGLTGFVPMVSGHRLDRHAIRGGAGGASGIEARLATFYAAIEAGSLHGLLELERLSAWRARADQAINDLSGRTPPLILHALMQHMAVSAELVAALTKCSKVSARRNLVLLEDRGLVREITGHSRYRFWSAAV
jgi:hypothetical protein